MSYAVTAMATFMATVLLCASFQLGLDRNNVKAGVIVVDQKPYRLVPID